MMERAHAELERLLRRRATGAAYQRKFANLNDADTRLVLADLSRVCNHHRSTCSSSLGGTMDPIGMAFEEGKRTAFLYILTRSRADARAVDEAIEREMTNAAR
jgi:hypothetical protein